jgi:hypothetical protein
MTLTRTDHWATRALHDFLIARARAPFVWGEHDCALFAADAVQAMTGVDIAADFRGKYSSEAEAFALIKELTGGETVADAAAWCAAKHGMLEWKHPLMAQRGDLVVLEESGRLIAGIVSLNGRQLLCAGESGLHRLPITDIKRAWHV